MKLNQLQHLMAIVEQGSLRAAARRLDLPQPALTRSIRSLEKELGVELFARQTTGMSLTAEGRRFQVRASAIVNEARRAKEEIQQARDDYQGTVSVALSIMPHIGMLPSTLPVFYRTYPKVRLRISENLLPAVESSLRDGSVDFYLGAAPYQPPSAGLSMQHLCKNTRVVVGRKNHPLLKSNSLKDLVKAEWATTAIDYNAEEDLARLFSKYKLQPPRVTFQAKSAMSVLVAVAQTDLLAMLPIQWIHNPMTKDLLQHFTLKEKIPAPSIVMVRRIDLPLTPPAEFFCDVLLRNLPTDN